MQSGIRKRLMSGAAVLVVLIGGLALPLSLRTISKTFERFEMRDGEQDMQRVELVVRSRLEELTRTTYDYADWNATAQFMRGEYPLYVADSISDDNMGAFDADFVFIADRQARLHAARAYGRGNGELPPEAALLPAQTALASQVLAMPAARALASGVPAKMGMVLRSGERWYMVGLSSITDPELPMPQPSLGMVAFVSELTEHRIAALHRLAGTPFQLVPADQAHGEAGTILVGERIYSSRPLHDTAGNITAALQLKHTRPLLAETRTTRNVLALTTIGAFLIGCALLIWFVERELVQRLVKMDHALGDLRLGRIQALDLSQHHDEVDRIGQSINEYAGELTRARERWEHEAHHDGLTGLGNRASLLRSIREAATTQRHGNLWLLLLDLDGFKPINDNYGHAAGDRVLCEVARRIRKFLPTGASAYRLGGDEFAVLASGADEAIMGSLARALNHAIDDPSIGGGFAVRTTASIGMASLALPQAEASAANDLLQRADIALYQVKRGQRNGMAVFDAQMQANVLHLRDVERALRQALDRGQIEAFFQPIVDARDMRVLRLEALARWRRDGQWMMPDTFIGIAEQSGLMAQLDAQVLRTALQALPQIRRIAPHVGMAVNASAQSLLDPHYLEEAIRLADEAEVNDGSLVLELTESTLVSNENALAPPLNTLQAFGIHVELDDFGVGYSSLGRLAQLNPFAIKLDGSFVRSWRSGGERICRAIVGMAEQLDIPVTAEFVEDAQDAQFLLGIGCTALQGYGISPPLPLDKLLAWLADGARPAMYAKADAPNS